jgi:hypothetical protein
MLTARKAKELLGLTETNQTNKPTQEKPTT